jgi:hypothetical protein
MANLRVLTIPPKKIYDVLNINFLYVYNPAIILAALYCKGLTGK